MDERDEYAQSEFGLEYDQLGANEKEWVDDEIAENEMVSEDMGGVGAPMATLTNTPGVGNATPASSAGLNTDGPSGSGDSWADDVSTGTATNESANDIYGYDGPDYVKYDGDSYEVVDYREHGRTPELLIRNLRSGYGVKNSPGGVYARHNTMWINIDEVDISNDEMYEQNLNPYDKIGAMMAKKMNVAQPFKKKDSKTNTIKQKKIDKVSENTNKFTIETLDSYEKASKHVPKHPLQESIINEDSEIAEDLDKNVKAKKVLSKLNIPFEYKTAKSGQKRTYLKLKVDQAMEVLTNDNWEEVDVNNNPTGTVRMFQKDDLELAIYTSNVRLPMVTVKPIKEEPEANESFKSINKIISNSIEPYI